MHYVGHLGNECMNIKHQYKMIENPHHSHAIARMMNITTHAVLSARVVYTKI